MAGERYLRAVARELDSGARREGLWARSLDAAAGDRDRAREIYTLERALELEAESRGAERPARAAGLARRVGLRLMGASAAGAAVVLYRAPAASENPLRWPLVAALVALFAFCFWEARRLARRSS